VVLLALVVSAGLLGGLARPPLGAHAVHPRLRHAGLLGGGAVLNAASLLFDGNVAILSLTASLAVLIAFAATNRHVTGIAVVGLGLLVNLAPVAMDGGMPVRPGALVRAGLVAPDDLVGTELRGARHLETDRDVLGVLGDALPLRPLGEVLSLGDLIVVAGAGDAVRELSRRRPRRRSVATDTGHRASPGDAPAGGSATIDLASDQRPTSTPELVG